MTLLKSSVLSSFAMLVAMPAFSASNAELEKMIENLEAVQKEQQEQIKILKSQLKEQKTQSISANNKSMMGDVEVSLKPAPHFKTKDGRNSFSIDGRVLTDAGFVTNDDGKLGDGANIRSMRFGIKGVFDYDWNYRFQVGFDNEDVSIVDAFLAYNGFDNLELKVGNFYELNGIEVMSGNLNTTFMERSSAVTTFRPSRTLGAAANIYDKQWSLQFGVFGDDPGNSDGDDEGRSLSGRFVAAPILDKEKDHVLHLGGSVRYRTPDASDDSIRFRSRGESNVIDNFLVDTGTISEVDDFLTYAGEMRYTNGPFALMSEYVVTDVNREASYDLSFSGGYALVSYFLTGEQRPYNAKTGSHGGLKPKSNFSLDGRGYGAFEVAARYGFLDLNDENISGGELNAYTLGLNWYPNANSRFMFNYVINNTDENGAFPDNDPHYFMARAQLSF